MTVLTQGIQPYEFLLSEANSTRSRDNATVTIAGGVALVSGQILGRITATGKYVRHDVAGADDGRRTAAAVLATPLDGVNGDVKATIFARDCEVITNRLNDGVAPTTLALTQLAAAGIIAR